MGASVEIARLLFVAHKIPVEERDRLRADLLAYCERDTWAMVRLMGRLKELAAGPAARHLRTIRAVGSTPSRSPQKEQGV